MLRKILHEYSLFLLLFLLPIVSLTALWKYNAKSVEYSFDEPFLLLLLGRDWKSDIKAAMMSFLCRVSALIPQIREGVQTTRGSPEKSCCSFILKKSWGGSTSDQDPSGCLHLRFCGHQLAGEIMQLKPLGSPSRSWKTLLGDGHLDQLTHHDPAPRWAAENRWMNEFPKKWWDFFFYWVSPQSVESAAPLTSWQMQAAWPVNRSEAGLTTRMMKMMRLMA